MPPFTAWDRQAKWGTPQVWHSGRANASRSCQHGTARYRLVPGPSRPLPAVASRHRSFRQQGSIAPLLGARSMRCGSPNSDVWSPRGSGITVSAHHMGAMALLGRRHRGRDQLRLPRPGSRRELPRRRSACAPAGGRELDLEFGQAGMPDADVSAPRAADWRLPARTNTNRSGAVLPAGGAEAGSGLRPGRCLACIVRVKAFLVKRAAVLMGPGSPGRGSGASSLIEFPLRGGSVWSFGQGSVAEVVAGSTVGTPRAFRPCR